MKVNASVTDRYTRIGAGNSSSTPTFASTTRTTIVKQIEEEVSDWWELVDTTIESMADFMFEKEQLMLVFVEEGLSSDAAKVFPDVASRIDSMFAAAIQQGIARGVVEVSDPELMASFFHHALEGTMMHASFHGEEIDRDRFVAAAKELVHKALAP